MILGSICLSFKPFLSPETAILGGPSASRKALSWIQACAERRYLGHWMCVEKRYPGVCAEKRYPFSLKSAKEMHHSSVVGALLALFWASLGPLLRLSLASLGIVSGFSWGCLGRFLGMSWASLGTSLGALLGLFGANFGTTLGLSSAFCLASLGIVLRLS